MQKDFALKDSFMVLEHLKSFNTILLEFQQFQTGERLKKRDENRALRSDGRQ